jgi:hypothetical protein
MTARAWPVPVFDRRTGRKFDEFMEDAPQTYETRPRRSLRQWLEAQPIYDRLIALYQESGFSRKKIEPFIRRHSIDMSEFKPVAYRSYAEFFDREFLPDARPFVEDPSILAAFAEARYFGWTRVELEHNFRSRANRSMRPACSAQRSAPRLSSAAPCSSPGYPRSIIIIFITRMTGGHSNRTVSAEALDRHLDGTTEQARHLPRQ